MGLQGTKDRYVVSSGDVFEKTGYYTLIHREHDGQEGFIPHQTYRMPFKRGDRAPKLISCQQDVEWELVFAC